MERICGKRFKRDAGGSDVCIMPFGHEGGCENAIGQGIPIQDPVSISAHVFHMPPEDFDPSCEKCTNGLRQEDMA